VGPAIGTRVGMHAHAPVAAAAPTVGALLPTRSSLPASCPALAQLVLRLHHDITRAPEEMHHPRLGPGLASLAAGCKALRHLSLVNCPLDGPLLQVGPAPGGGGALADPSRHRHCLASRPRPQALAASPLAEQLQQLELGYCHSYAACTSTLQTGPDAAAAAARATTAALEALLARAQGLRQLALLRLELSSAALDAVGCSAPEQLEGLTLHACAGVTRWAGGRWGEQGSRSARLAGRLPAALGCRRSAGG
jgi:hypothetical protein